MTLRLPSFIKDSITFYTSLSATTFFTAVAIALAFYYITWALFGWGIDNRISKNPVRVELQSVRPPVQLGEITEEELKAYNGSRSCPDKPLLMAIKGQIYDVSQGRFLYGPYGPYALFTGKDASRALAKKSFEEQDITGDISDLSPSELETLQDWESKFMDKYIKVGTIKKDVGYENPTGTDKPVEIGASS